MEKRSHLGMAGHYAALSEFLYRGYNVAVPAVDIGDDAYVVEDQVGAMWRLQVKTTDRPEERVATYLLSRRQLRDLKENELFFMFMARRQQRWRFILIARPSSPRSGTCSRQRTDQECVDAGLLPMQTPGLTRSR